MRAEIEARVKAFRRALELAAGDRAGEPVPSIWHKELGSFPDGCCELASQTLVEYLKEHDDKLISLTECFEIFFSYAFTHEGDKNSFIPRCC